VVDYLEDIKSDFSRFHRIENIFALTGPRFCSLAFRIVNYGGVVHAVAQRQNEEEQARRPGGPTPFGATEVPAEAAIAMLNDGQEF
jgi:hypothetical protein